ncbi:hypothetical protein FBR04_06815 [Betaproteobacteria bacterium PRO7]|jgi:hypothetical protein|nr:hypothetical protein [Betaproteobacteria bacterium PRO7]
MHTPDIAPNAIGLGSSVHDRQQRILALAAYCCNSIYREAAKRGAALAREYKWLGSHRYAVMNLCAPDEARLRARYEAICRRFGWPAPY